MNERKLHFSDQVGETSPRNMGESEEERIALLFGDGNLEPVLSCCHKLRLEGHSITPLTLEKELGWDPERVENGLARRGELIVLFKPVAENIVGGANLIQFGPRKRTTLQNSLYELVKLVDRADWSLMRNDPGHGIARFITYIGTALRASTWRLREMGEIDQILVPFEDEQYEATAESTSFPETDGSEQIFEALKGSLENLREPVRIAFTLRFFDQIPTPEIAETLGVHRRTVYDYLDQAEELIRRELLKEGIPPKLLEGRFRKREKGYLEKVDTDQLRSLYWSRGDLLTPRERAIIKSLIGLENGFPETAVEIAKRMGIPEEYVRHHANRALRTLEGRRTAGKTGRNKETFLENKRLVEGVYSSEAWHSLSERERWSLSAYFLSLDKPTQREIGEALGVNTSTANYILKRAISKLRRWTVY